MARRWWRKRALRIYYPHLSMAEMALLDVPSFVAACVQTNAEAIVVHAAGLHATYPTQVPCHHVPEALADRDLLGQVSEGLRGQGLRVIARCDFSQVRRADAETHPEWMASDGDDAEYSWTCPTSPYQGDALAVPVVVELLDRYGVDGLFFDGIGYPSAEGCPACQSAYGEAERSGLEWLIWRQERLAAQQRALYDAAQAVKPDVFCFGRHVGSTAMSLAASQDVDLVAQGHALTVVGMQAENAAGRHSVHATGLSAELARGARRKRRPLIIVRPGSGPVGESGSERTMAVPMAEQQRAAYQAVAHGASVMVESRGCPDAMADPREAAAMREGFARMRAQADVLDAGFKVIHDVALVWPTAAGTRARVSRQPGLYERLLDVSHGLSLALQSGHVQCGVLHDRRMSAKALRRHGAVVVPALEMLDEQKLALLLEYVLGGGRALIGDAASPMTEARERMLTSLSQALGSDLSVEVTNSGFAMPNTAPGSPLRQSIGAVMVGGLNRVIADAGDAMIWMQTHQHGTASMAVNEPLMVSQALGDGVLTYCSWALGAGYRDAVQTDVTSLVAQAIRFGAELAPRLNVDAPACVEVTMAHWRDGVVIHLVNHASALMGDVTPVGPIGLDLAWDGPAQVVLAKPGRPDQALPCQEQWNRVTITVPRVEIYAQVVVRTG